VKLVAHRQRKNKEARKATYDYGWHILEEEELLVLSSGLCLNEKQKQQHKKENVINIKMSHSTRYETAMSF
jgi:hypothetical protein